MVLAFLGTIESHYGIFINYFIKNAVEIVANWKYFYNFVFREYSGAILSFY